MGCVGKAWSCMCCPDAEYTVKSKGQRKPNPRAAGSRIMRLQHNVNFKTGMRKCSIRQERKRL